MDSLYEAKQFEDLLINSDLRYYLKASPFEAGERSSLDTVLSEEYYYNHLYAHSQEAENKIQEMIKRIKNDNVHNFILAGYKGCGKSTFIRYFTRRLKIRSQIINFDNYWDPDKGIKSILVSYLDRRIEDDLFPKNGQEPCIITNKYIELFWNNKDNLYRIGETDTENYLIYFGDKIRYAKLLSQSNQEDALRKYFDTDIKIHILNGAESKVKRYGATISNVMTLILFWDIAERIAKHLTKECCFIFENLDVIYNTPDVSALADHIIAFRNNVDTLVPTLWYEDKQLPNPTQNYILVFVMRETTEGEFSSYIEHFSDGKVYFQPYTDISDIYDIHDIVYQRSNWLNVLSETNRCFSQSSNINQIRNKSNLLLRLLDDQHLRKKLFGFYNNDYRTFVEVLSSVDLKDSKLFNSCDKLLALNKKEGYEWSAFAYRSVIYREIFNIYVKEGYINTLNYDDYSERKGVQLRSINLDRMILLYLSNSVSNLFVEEDNKQWQFVSLDKLFTEMLSICNEPDSIIDALWSMYNLRKASKWNHLITFDNMYEISRKELLREMTAYQSRDLEFEFGRVKITLAGENYLNHVLPHFEFYAARHNVGTGHSLFSLSAEEWCDLDKIDSIFKGQRNVIRSCCSKLYLFHTEVLCKRPEYRDGAFLQSKFAAIKYSIDRNSLSKMYHCERIIHSNIGYVNRLRFYVAYIMDSVLLNDGFNNDIEIKPLLNWFRYIDSTVQKLWPKDADPRRIKQCKLLRKNNNGMQTIRVIMNSGITFEKSMPLNWCISIIKACINAKLIDVIKSYIRMFGIPGLRGISNGKKCAMYSPSTEKLCNAFVACINEISDKYGYTDFETSIDVSTGSKLIRCKNDADKIKRDQQRHNESKKKYRAMQKDNNQQQSDQS